MEQAVRPTEAIESRYLGLDTWPDATILGALVAGQEQAIAAVRAAIPALAAAADAIARSLRNGGKLFYAGAGTSIRVGVQDGSELPATYGIDESKLGYLIAGGRDAMFETLADKEDSVEDGRFAAAACGPKDAVLVIAASGRTPFTIAVAEEAKRRGSTVIAVVNAPGSALAKAADVDVVLESGAEVIAGSTRMGAGTAQKAALNLISTLVGIKLGAVHDGMMVAMRPENDKLKMRASHIVSRISGAAPAKADAALAAAGDIKPAVLLCLGAKSKAQAQDLLAATGGNLRNAMRHLEDNHKSNVQH